MQCGQLESVVSERQNAEVWRVTRERRPKWPSATFLAALEEQELRDLVCYGELVEFRKGTPLIIRGEQKFDVFLLLDAVVKVTAPLDNEGEVLLAVRMGGDIVGEIAFADEQPRTATVTACGPVLAVRLDRHDLRAAINRHPRAGESLMSAITRKFRGSLERHIEISSFPPRVRVARALLVMAVEYGYKTEKGTSVGVSLTRTELGTLVGVSESTVQRALRALEREDLVKSSGRQQFLIPDMAALRRATL